MNVLRTSFCVRRTRIIFLVLCTLHTAHSTFFAAPPRVDIAPLDFKPTQAERVVLKNGVVVYLMEDHELPLFDMNIRIKSSQADELKPDTIPFLGQVWRTGGTKKRPPEKLNDELEFLPASVEIGADGEVFSVSLSCLRKDINQGLDIFADVLFEPAFDAQQLTLSQAKAMESLLRKNETPSQIARRAFRDVVYGKKHVYAYEPTEKSIAGVTRGDLIALHKKVVVPDHAIISVAGDFKKEELIAALEDKFSSWQPTGRVVPPFDYSVKESTPSKLFYVEKDFNQSRITIGRIGISRHSPDHFSLALADYILGGGGPSRLFGEIRSRLGLAYVVGSFVQEPVGPGMAGVGCQTKAASTVQAIKAIQTELDKFSAGPIRDEEMRLAKDFIINSYVFGFDSSNEVANARAVNEFYGFSGDYLEIYTGRIEAVSKDEVQRVAKKYFSKEGMKIMVVGNEKKFDTPLSSVGEVVKIPLELVN